MPQELNRNTFSGNFLKKQQSFGVEAGKVIFFNFITRYWSVCFAFQQL